MQRTHLSLSGNGAFFVFMVIQKYLGWCEIPESKNYCDDCIVLEKEKAIQELKDSFIRIDKRKANSPIRGQARIGSIGL
jgi:hypothetical protein